MSYKDSQIIFDRKHTKLKEYDKYHSHHEPQYHRTWMLIMRSYFSESYQGGKNATIFLHATLFVYLKQRAFI